MRKLAIPTRDRLEDVLEHVLDVLAPEPPAVAPVPDQGGVRAATSRLHASWSWALIRSIKVREVERPDAEEVPGRGAGVWQNLIPPGCAHRGRVRAL